MRRIGLMVAVVSGVVATLMLSRGITDPGNSPGWKEGFDIEVQEKNPWTFLKANADPAQFQFAIVSDRTGGHRAGVFSRAVRQINLLQPEFVMSVGDLIEGSRDMDTNRRQWAEFNGFVKQLQMPFFYVPGNHDANTVGASDTWKEIHGRRMYHFAYKGCLFVCINTSDEGAEDPRQDASYRTPRITEGQRKLVARALTQYPGARHTFLFMHHPVWNQKDLAKSGWLELEKLMGDRLYTAFCGHVHVFHKFIRNGRNLYQLATTGGGSSMRGAEYGEIDQVAWVTMKEKGPVISHIGLHGIYRDDLASIVTDEPGTQPRWNPATLNPVQGSVALKGKPGAGLLVVFTKVPEKAEEKPVVGNARTDAVGGFEVYGKGGAKGLPAGKYQVSFAPAPSLVSDADSREAAPVAGIPEKYRNPATTPILVDLRKDAGRFDFQLD